MKDSKSPRSSATNVELTAADIAALKAFVDAVGDVETARAALLALEAQQQRKAA